MLTKTRHCWATALALSFCALVSRNVLCLETSVKIVYPLDNAVEKLPVRFATRIDILHGTAQEFTELYGEMHLCMETVDVNGEKNLTCSAVLDRDTVFQHTKVGNFTTRAFMTASGSIDAERHFQSNAVTFSVVSEAQFDAQIARQIQERGQNFPDFDLGILEWAAQMQRQQNDSLLKKLERDLNTDSINTEEQELMLVVGIKTAVVTNFAIRQAIRQTWARKDVLPVSVKVFFLGCRPSIRMTNSNDSAESFSEDSTESRRLWGAIELEKLVYGDLLTDELDCDDSYEDLANKVKEFLHFTATTYAHACYVMIADDDVYVRMEEVVHKLQTISSRTRFYSGQVHAIENAQKETPIRDKKLNFRYALSEELYPMNELVPFAIGAYFFLSMDCVHFIAKNYRRLHSLDGMDDMSMALWLLTIQVHAQPFRNLQHLRAGPCTDNLVVLGDLSPLSIRLVHSNILNQDPMCRGFNQHLWMKPKALAPVEGYAHTLPHFTEPLEFSFSLRDTGHVLGIVSVISTPSLAGVKLSYFPSLETPSNYFGKVCVLARLHFAGAVKKRSCAEITSQARFEIQRYSKEADDVWKIDPSRIHLWRFNVVDASESNVPLFVAYDQSASYSRVLLECLVASVFEAEMRPVLVIPVDLLHQHYGVQPDVLVFSSLGKCSPASKPECKAMVAEYFQRYNTIGTTATSVGSTQLVMVSGEAWSTDGLDERVLLISTLTNANRAKHIYLSMASISFAERLDHGPLSLLSPLETENAAPKTKFCAYLFSHCEHSNREIMYDTLNALRPVDALGKCAGSSRPPDYTKLASRETTFYNDDAVQQYAPFKFVIAFENTRATGYVTEKLVNAFLAGSVPVYWGDSKTVSELFNPKSFIDCDRFESLQSCAEYVVYVDDSPEMYSRMRQEAPVTNMTAFNEAFSWHPTVSNRFMADEVLQHLHS